MIEATKLLEDMKRVQRSTAKGRYKGKNETKSDFIKKRNRYVCVYCLGKTNPKKLRTSVEKFHFVKEEDTLASISEYYQTKPSVLIELNSHLDMHNLVRGEYVKLATDFKVFPNTHGICFCEKCATDKQNLKLSHVDYMKHVIKKRKESRNLINDRLRKKIFARDNYECVYCIREHGKSSRNINLTVDHKKPIVSGGTSDEENLCTSCKEHNIDKGKMSYDDYLKKIKKRKFLKENSVHA